MKTQSIDLKESEERRRKVEDALREAGYRYSFVVPHVVYGDFCVWLGRRSVIVHHYKNDNGLEVYAPLTDENSIPALIAAIKRSIKPEPAEALIRELADTITEAHDQHIFDEDDPHPADCGYCAIVARAEKFLRGDNDPGCED